MMSGLSLSRIREETVPHVFFPCHAYCTYQRSISKPQQTDAIRSRCTSSENVRMYS